MRAILAHSRRIALLSGVLLLVAASPALAQRGPHHGAHRGPHGPGHGAGQGMGRMLERLDLNDDQRKQADQIVAEHHSAMVATAASMRERRRVLFDAIHAEEFDETAIRLAAADVAEVEADLAVERARTVRDILALLSPEQREQAQEMMQRRRFESDD